MFDLEQAINEWRLRFSDGGVRDPEILAELESHLRDEVERRVRAGVHPEEALQQAIEQIGDTDLVGKEFAKVDPIKGARQIIEHVIVTLAGNTSMNTNSNIEPAWATYLKAIVFIFPAISLWTISIVWVFPKLQMICRDTGVPMPSVYQLTNLVSEHTVPIVIALILTLIVLEWRFSKWSRYRRATIGIGVFLLNTAILFLITLMVFVAVVAAPAFAAVAK